MSSSKNHAFSMPFASFRRPITTIRSNHFNSQTTRDPNLQIFESFQKQVFSRFHELSVASPDELLSISWLQKLLNAFTACQEDFKLILNKNKSQFKNPQSDKLLDEFFDRAIKALDIFNSSREGIEKIRTWNKHLEIITSALEENQFRRAKKTLTDLSSLMVMPEEKESGSIFSNSTRSFGRKSKQNTHLRSLSWSVSHTWSASKQLQSIANTLIAPRDNEIAILVFTMSFILLFVLWILVASIPCQDRGVNLHFTIPRNFSWSTPLFLIHSRVMDESKKKDRRNSNGLMREIYRIEKGVSRVNGLVDFVNFPLSDEVKEELRENVDELSLVCEICKKGLDPLDRKLKEVFVKIMNCRTEGIEALGKAIGR